MRIISLKLAMQASPGTESGSVGGAAGRAIVLVANAGGDYPRAQNRRASAALPPKRQQRGLRAGHRFHHQAPGRCWRHGTPPGIAQHIKQQLNQSAAAASSCPRAAASAWRRMRLKIGKTANPHAYALLRDGRQRNLFGDSHADARRSPQRPQRHPQVRSARFAATPPRAASSASVCLAYSSTASAPRREWGVQEAERPVAEDLVHQ